MMLPSYCLIPRILRWFRRFRQRRGYGVHSPFAFEWITDVVYLQKAQYYAYAHLSKHHEVWPGVLSVKDARLLFRMANHIKATCILVVGERVEREIHYLKAARPSATMVHFADEAAVDQAFKQGLLAQYRFDFVLWMAAASPSLAHFSHLCPKISESLEKNSEIFPKKSESFEKMSDISLLISESSEHNSATCVASAEISPSSMDVKAPHSALSPLSVFVLFLPHANEERTTAWQSLQQLDYTTVSFDLHRFGVAFCYPKLQRQHYVVNYF